MKPTIKKLIKGYLEKADKKLQVAIRLFNNMDYEYAVPRAYYVVYHVAQDPLLSEGEKAYTHKGVLTLFGLLFVNTGKFNKNIAKYLAILKDDRESGDYEVFSYIDKETVESAIEVQQNF